MPYIRACTISAKQTGKGAEDKQEADQRRQSRGKSKAKGHCLQKPIYRQ